MDKKEFIEQLESFGLPKTEYMIRSGGSLLLRGLREETADFDLCVSKELADRLGLERYPRDESGSYVPFPDVQMKANLEKFSFDVIDGYQCETLESILALKQRLMRPKDLRDIEVIKSKLNRMTDYDLIIKQMEALADVSSDPVAVMANAAALLFHSMDDINWAGFYLVKNGRLVLGPFQGRVACAVIEKGRGVCGTAWKDDCVQVAADVHAFPGHIACDTASRSEIVVPVHQDKEVFAVLDIDSPVYDRFHEEDRAGLVEFARSMERILAEGNTR